MYWLKGIKNANSKPIRVYEYISFEAREITGIIDLALVEVDFESHDVFLKYLQENQKLSKKE